MFWCPNDARLYYLTSVVVVFFVVATIVRTRNSKRESRDVRNRPNVRQASDGWVKLRVDEYSKSWNHFMNDSTWLLYIWRLIWRFHGQLEYVKRLIHLVNESVWAPHSSLSIKKKSLVKQMLVTISWNISHIRSWVHAPSKYPGRSIVITFLTHWL